MKDVFHLLGKPKDAKWKTLGNMGSELISDWRKKSSASGIDQAQGKLSSQIGEGRFSSDALPLIRAARELVGSRTSLAAIPHVFIVTDANGTVGGLIGSQEVLGACEQMGIKKGTSFALQAAGLNAISMSIETGEVCLLEGAEHELSLFKDWTCICAPITCEGKVMGFLDYSFSASLDPRPCALLLLELQQRLQEHLCASCPDRKREALYELFNRYGLTKREKEVAEGWLQNQSTLQISLTMNITEGTVRNMLKKIYSKTGVSDKGQYFRKFLF